MKNKILAVPILMLLLVSISLNIINSSRENEKISAVGIESSVETNNVNDTHEKKMSVSEKLTFVLARSKTEIKLKDLVMSPISNLSSLTIEMPNGVELVPGSVPSSWKTYNQPTDKTINYLMEDPNGVDVYKFLNQIKFKITDEEKLDGPITIGLSDKPLSAWVDPEGVTHYYEFIEKKTDWSTAYNEAKLRRHNGLTGYLATITSYDEQNYIYNSIAKLPGLLGGTRLLKKVQNMPPNYINDDRSIGSNIQSDFDNGYPTWYWATGPEAGLVFYNGKDQSASGPVPYVYNHFAHGEPNNNYEGGEAVLQFAMDNSPMWNDISWNVADSKFNKGYYVEYSEYGNQKEAGSTSRPIPEFIQVKYLEEGTNAELAPSVILPESDYITYGDAYTTEEKIIDGKYAVKRVVGETTGTVDDTVKTVIYYYGIGEAKAYYKDEAGDEIPGYPSITQTGKYDVETFTFTDLPIDGYELLRVEGPVTGLFERDLIETTFIYRKNTLNLIQMAKRLDGSEATEVKIGEKLQYRVELTSNAITDEPAIYYDTLTLTEPLSPYLNEPTDFSLKKTDGSSVGNVTYDETTRTLTGTIVSDDQVSRMEPLILSYKASVKFDAPVGSAIKEKATAEGSYTNGSTSGVFESNEVSSTVIYGDLLFEKAPTSFRFGDSKTSNSSTISPMEKNYPLQVKDGNFSVRDLRGTGNQWSMTAKMTKVLTNASNGSTLPESMHYLSGGSEQLIGTNISALIHDETTESVDPVDFSDSWDASRMLFVKTVGGQVKLGEYQGIIQWTLQDVPGTQ